jgi:hypothetical protein
LLLLLSSVLSAEAAPPSVEGATVARKRLVRELDDR